MITQSPVHTLARRIVCLALLLSLSGQAVAAEAPLINESLGDATRFLFNDAHQKLEQVQPEPAEDRRLRLLRAAMLINVQPVTEGNLETALGSLQRLVEEKADDEAGIAARYLVARIRHVHLTPPDPEEAARLYFQLFEEHPASFYGQLAFVKYALVWAVQSLPRPEQENRLTALEELMPRLTSRSALRDVHDILGTAYLRFGLSKRKALEHYIAAEEHGFPRHAPQAYSLVRIGELARELGETEIALRHYREFVSKFERDDRTHTIQQRIEELTAP